MSSTKFGVTVHQDSTRCKECGMRVRGKQHVKGSHHQMRVREPRKLRVPAKLAV